MDFGGVEYSLEAMATPVDTLAVPVPYNLSGEAHMYYGSVDLSGNRMVLTLDNEGAILPQTLEAKTFGKPFVCPLAIGRRPSLYGVSTPDQRRGPGHQWRRPDHHLHGVCFAGIRLRRQTTWQRVMRPRVHPATRCKLGAKARTWAPNSAGKETQPSLSSDGNTLLFARAPRGLHQPTDLFVSHCLVHGGWSTPKRLEGAVNTPRYEESPFLHPDGKTLYFSSDGHPGLGDLDVFVSRKLPDGTWGKPTNLGPSINGPGKDNSLLVMPRGNEAMFSSDRDTGWDSFWTIPLKEEAKPIEVATLKGVVQDATTLAYLEAEVSLLDATNGQTITEHVEWRGRIHDAPYCMGSYRCRRKDTYSSQ